MSMRMAILGAGPIGLEVALAAAERGMDFTLYEASLSVAGNVRSWGHVQLFTPWDLNLSPRARAALARVGREPPSGEGCPTGAEMVDLVFEPLSKLPTIAPHIRYGSRVVDIGRDRMVKSDAIGTGARADHPFRLLLRDPEGVEWVEHADLVLDCTGAYEHPNALGSGGIPAPGERAAEEYIIRRIPDLEAPFLTGDTPGWGDQRILLVGAGHSAQTTARDLEELVDRHPATRVIWVVRSPTPTFGAIEDDVLPARCSLTEHARRLTGPDSPFDVRLGRTVDALEPSPEGIVVTLRPGDGSRENVTVDRIISLTGSVGEARMYRQLQIHECWATSGPMKLAASLLASSSADCMTQSSHGVETLKNPEPNFYILGSKSYGRNNTFLMRIGWEQVDEVFSTLNAVESTAAETP